MEFLTRELKVCSGTEAQDRVFFVSAREALVSRTNEDQGTPTPTGQLLDGFQNRLFEFANFERKFEVVGGGRACLRFCVCKCWFFCFLVSG